MEYKVVKAYHEFDIDRILRDHTDWKPIHITPVVFFFPNTKNDPEYNPAPQIYFYITFERFIPLKDVR